MILDLTRDKLSNLMAQCAVLHNPNYQFDDEIIPLGASLLARLVEQQSRQGI
jgi:hypothetical protein